jgi:hypothetical protein
MISDQEWEEIKTIARRIDAGGSSSDSSEEELEAYQNAIIGVQLFLEIVIDQYERGRLI